MTSMMLLKMKRKMSIKNLPKMSTRMRKKMIEKMNIEQLLHNINN
jgi:hypothetical protein